MVEEVLSKSQMLLKKILASNLLFAAIASVVYLCLYLLAVQTAGIPIHTPFGPEVAAVFPAIGEIKVQVALMKRLGPMTGAAITLSSYALGLAINAPGIIGPTTYGKFGVILALALLMKFRPKSSLALWFAVGLVVDTFVFALSYGHPEVIPASLFIKSLFYAANIGLLGAYDFHLDPVGGKKK